MKNVRILVISLVAAIALGLSSCGVNLDKLASKVQTELIWKLKADGVEQVVEKDLELVPIGNYHYEGPITLSLEKEEKTFMLKVYYHEDRLTWEIK